MVAVHDLVEKLPSPVLRWTLTASLFLLGGAATGGWSLESAWRRDRIATENRLAEQVHATEIQVARLAEAMARLADAETLRRRDVEALRVEQLESARLIQKALDRLERRN